MKCLAFFPPFGGGRHSAPYSEPVRETRVVLGTGHRIGIVTGREPVHNSQIIAAK